MWFKSTWMEEVSGQRLWENTVRLYFLPRPSKGSSEGRGSASFCCHNPIIIGRFGLISPTAQLKRWSYCFISSWFYNLAFLGCFSISGHLIRQFYGLSLYQPVFLHSTENMRRGPCGWLWTQAPGRHSFHCLAGQTAVTFQRLLFLDCASRHHWTTTEESAEVLNNICWMNGYCSYLHCYQSRCMFLILIIPQWPNFQQSMTKFYFNEMIVCMFLVCSLTRKWPSNR